MSFAYSDIAVCAQRILGVVGPCSEADPMLFTSGRPPVMPDVNLGDLLPPSTYNRLHPSTRIQVFDMVHARLSEMRSRMQGQYLQLVGQYRSLSRCGLTDMELEAKLLQTFEARYSSYIENLRAALIELLDRKLYDADNRNTRGGFGDRNLLILDQAFKHTTTPLSAEIDHISKLTSLEPHQVRTWFQNKRNRGNKKKPSTLRTASASHVQQPTQPVHAGRRVASLPSRKYVPAPAGRPTRSLPHRAARPNVDVVPLSRTFSQDSDSHGSVSTTFSYSDIPANGGFQGFDYPSAAPPLEHGNGVQPNYNYDQVIIDQYGRTQAGQGREQVYGSDQYSFDPITSNQYNLDFNYANDPVPDLDFEYLNFDIDALAPPTDDLANLGADIQAALRSSDQFTNTTLTPQFSLSPSTQESPLSELSLSQDWFSELTEGEAESMQLLKVVLDGMGMEMSEMGESPIEKTMMGLSQAGSGQDMGMGVGISGSRSESPETVASFGLYSQCGSGRASPYSTTNLGQGGRSSYTPNSIAPHNSRSISISASTTTTSSTLTSSGTMDGEAEFPFMFDFEQVSNQSPEPRIEEKWMMDVLPFQSDMGDQVMGTA